MTARVSHPGVVEEQHAGGQVVRGSNLAGAAETVQTLHLCTHVHEAHLILYRPTMRWRLRTQMKGIYRLS
jgi:hypothetical protein